MAATRRPRHVEYAVSAEEPDATTVVTIIRQMPIGQVEISDGAGTSFEAAALHQIAKFIENHSPEHRDENGWFRPINDIFTATYNGHRVKVSLGDGCDL
jgi:hypothetical protein